MISQRLGWKEGRKQGKENESDRRQRCRFGEKMLFLIFRMAAFGASVSHTVALMIRHLTLRLESAS